MIRVSFLAFLATFLGPSGIGQASLSVQTGAPISFEALDQAEIETAVLDVYQRMEELAAEAGYDVDIEIQSVRTLTPQEMARQPYLDSLTLPGGRTLHLNAGTKTRQGRLTELQVEVGWTNERVWPDNPEALDTLRAMSLSEILLGNSEGAYGPDQARLSLASAASLYQVTVSFAGESRTYKAMALWLPPLSEAATAELSLVDHVFPSNALASSLSLQIPVSGLALEPLIPGELEGVFDEASGLNSCEVSEDNINRSTTTYDQADHITGSHNGGLGVTFECSCEEGCRSNCDVQFTWKVCEEWGNVRQGRAIDCHKISPVGFDSTTDSVPHAQAQGARCTAGVGCAWKYCLGCACGSITISVAARQFGAFEYQTATPGATPFGKSIGYTCDPCVEEQGDPAPGGGGGGGETPLPCDTPGCTQSPILLHLGPGQPRLTDLEGGVRFDLDADGQLEQVSWTEAGSEDAFLVLDRNGNGLIDDASELFGNNTPGRIEDSSNPNGYQALRGLDFYEPLGESVADGWIRAGEASFEELMLWFDRNHDGISQAHELEALEDRGLSGISYNYRTSGRRDRHGNTYRYWGFVELQDRPNRKKSYDVFLWTLEVEEPVAGP